MHLSTSFPKMRATGIDAYKDAVFYGKKAYNHISFVHGDAHKLPFNNSMFDVVVCTEVLEHVDKPEMVLQEIKRIMKKDGVAYIEMDTGNLLFRMIWFWWTTLRRGVWRHAHIQVFTDSLLEKMLKDAKFNILDRKIFNCSMGVLFVVKK